MDFSDRPAWIVDGQQRVIVSNRLKRKDYPVSVVGFVADDVKTEREQFVLVNNVRLSQIISLRTTSILGWCYPSEVC